MLRFRPLLAAAAVLALLATACGDDDKVSATAATNPAGSADTTAAPVADPREGWPSKIVFAAVPSEQESQLAESYKVTVAILEGELGLDVEFQTAADYAGVIEGQIAGRVDLAQFGPFSYFIARQNGADIVPVGVMTSERGVEPGYQSFGYARVDDDSINSIEDAKGKNVCYVDPGSTSGYLYPAAGLLAVRIDPEKDVKAVFAGGHDASAIATANGDCDWGFSFDTMLTQRLVERGDLTGVVDEVDGQTYGTEPELKILWKSEVIAGSPVALLNKYPDSFREALIDVFNTKINADWALENGYCESAQTCKFSDEEIWGYTYKDDSFYDGIRVVCELTKSTKCG